MKSLLSYFRKDPLAAAVPPVKAAPPAPVESRKAKVEGRDAAAPSALDPRPSTSLARIIRPQAQGRWTLPMLGALTPQYIEMLLRSAMAGSHLQQWELFDLMLDTWPELAACAAELTEGVMARKFTVDPYMEEEEEATDTASEKARLISAALRTMKPDVAADENDFTGLKRDLVDGWFRGCTVQEIVWESRPIGRLGTCLAPQCTVWVHPANYGFAGGVLGLRANPAAAGGPALSPTLSFAQQQGSAGALAPFPQNKFLLGIHKAKSGSVPAGALLRPLAWWWCAANFSADWLLRLAELFGLPFRWAQFDPNAPQAVIDSICTMLQNMGSAGWAAFPTGTTIELKEPGKQGSDHSPQGELLDRSDRYVRLVLLGQTQSGGKGSAMGGQAFGTVEAGVKEQRIQSCADYVAGVINGQLIPAILTLNYGADADEIPACSFVTVKEDDLVQKSTVVMNLCTAGAGKAIGLDWIGKTFGIPKPDGDEETMEKIAPPGPSTPSTADVTTKGAKDTKEEMDPMEAKQLRRLRRVLAIEDDTLFAKGLEAIATA